MNYKTCCFIGHKDVSEIEELKAKIYTKCEELIVSQKVNCFWVGNYGAFDRICANTIRRLKEKYKHVELDLVIPYLTKEINENRDDYYKNYDHILIADISESTPKRLRIIKCNEYMIDNSNHLISYVNRSYGGAAKALEYAKNKVSIIIQNLV